MLAACRILRCLLQATFTFTCATATVAREKVVLLPVPGLAATALTWTHSSRMKPQQQQLLAVG
jgi:hypothetical protein